LAGSRCNPLCCNKSVFCSTSLRIGTNNDRCGWTNPAYRTRRGNWLSYLVLSEQQEIDKQLRLLSDRVRYGRIFAGWNLATLVTAGISVVGGLVVLACRPRPRPRQTLAPGALLRRLSLWPRRSRPVSIPRSSKVLFWLARVRST
jgi:hypothetical protein